MIIFLTCKQFANYVYYQRECSDKMSFWTSIMSLFLNFGAIHRLNNE